MSLFVWSIIDLQHYVSPWYRTQWLDISIHYKMITILSLVTICHHTKVLHCYWLSSPCCLYISFLWLIYFVTGSLYLLVSLTYFTHLPTPLPTGNHLFVLCIYDFVSVLLCLFFCFLDSTYKWNHVVFVFLCLTYFT